VLKKCLFLSSRNSHKQYPKLFESSLSELGYSVKWLLNENNEIELSSIDGEEFDLFFSTSFLPLMESDYEQIFSQCVKSAIWITGAGAYGLSIEYEKFILEKFDHIFANSYYWFNTLNKKECSEKITKQHLGYDSVFQAKVSKKKYPISFVGTIYPPRLGYLMQYNGFPLHLWAPRWDEWLCKFYDLDVSFHGLADSDEMMRIFSESTLVFNPIFHDALNMRLFECGFAGIPQLCLRTDEVEKYFVDEVDILLYSSEEELHGKLNKYLNDECALRAMAINMKKKCEMEHKLCSRVSTIIETVTVK
jgi:hypothetical protein